MTNKSWSIIGGCYAVFAIATFMVAAESFNSNVITEAKDVANSSKSNVVSSQRLDKPNPRRNLFLTIWTTRGCHGCEQQKAEIPALEKAGYNVILRTVPAPRFVKSFPTTVVTKDSPTGERIATVTGFKTTSEFDTILKISDEDDEDDEVPDYNILYSQFNDLNLIVWLRNSPLGRRQYKEIEKLVKLGINVNVHMVETEKTPRWLWATPTVILVDLRQGTVVSVWIGELVTSEDILNVLH